MTPIYEFECVNQACEANIHINRAVSLTKREELECPFCFDSMSLVYVNPKYDFKCQSCESVQEIKASFSEELIAPTCCDLTMKRDYTNDNAGFLPTAGMYAADNRR